MKKMFQEVKNNIINTKIISMKYIQWSDKHNTCIHDILKVQIKLLPKSPAVLLQELDVIKMLPALLYFFNALKMEQEASLVPDIAGQTVQQKGTICNQPRPNIKIS